MTLSCRQQHEGGLPGDLVRSSPSWEYRVVDNFEHRVDDRFTFGFLRTNRGAVTNRFASGVQSIVF